VSDATQIPSTGQQGPPGWRVDPAPAGRRRWWLLGAVGAAVVAASVVAVVLVSGRDEGRGAPTTAYSPTSALDLAERSGCADAVKGASGSDLFVQQVAVCRDAAWTVEAADVENTLHVSFYVFGNNDGRDGWLRAAQTFGDVGVIQGDRWVVEIPDGLPDLDAVASRIVQRLGGTRVS
jgi:hypothetical protein